MEQSDKLSYEQLEVEFNHCQEMIRKQSEMIGQANTEKISLQILLKNKSAELAMLQEQFLSQVEKG